MHTAIDPEESALSTARAAGSGFTSPEWVRLGMFYGAVAAVHGAGWSLLLRYSAGHASLIGLGSAAYMLGMRHAFDADHIAAVDDTVRYQLDEGRRSLGIGFFFSLGHSTVVFILCLMVALAGARIERWLPDLQSAGATIGGAISGSFLCLLGLMNLRIVLRILSDREDIPAGRDGHTHLQQLLARRGSIKRLFGGRWRRWIRHSWQMYPLGMLFGLSFDTASEVALLAMAAVASASALPVPAVLSLPLLFAAGMSVMDTTDGVLMLKAYCWAYVNPAQKLVYNLAITGLSAAVALLIGAIDWLQVLRRVMHPEGRFYAWLATPDLDRLGYLIVTLFVIVWMAFALQWRFSGSRQRRAPGRGQANLHRHQDGSVHVHRHFSLRPARPAASPSAGGSRQ